MSFDTKKTLLLEVDVQNDFCPEYTSASGKEYPTGALAVWDGDKVVAPLQYDGTMDSRLFRFWFETMLLPSVCADSVIVMDNARFHQKKALREMAERFGCRVLFLPPYSPDLNPIEHLWAWLKSTLRKILPQFVSLDHAIADCFMLV